MSLLIKLKPSRLTYSLLTIFFLTSAVFYPIFAGDADTTLGDLSARIEELENQINGKEGKTNDANPGDHVSHEDLEPLKDEIRALRDTQDRLRDEIRILREDIKHSQKESLRSEGTSKKSAPSIADPLEEKLISKRKEEPRNQTQFSSPLEKDEETDSVLKLLEQSAPGEDERDGPPKQKKELEEIRAKATKHAEETAPKLSAGNAEAQYNEAFALHDKGAYKEAERAFDYFITTYPNDPLVLKAMYWKAESCLKQGKQKEAKILFVNAYKKNPRGPKAPDCLLKLGETLAIQGKKEAACTAWRKLKTDFPHMTSEMKSELTTLKKKYGCDQNSEKAPMSVPKA